MKRSTGVAFIRTTVESLNGRSEEAYHLVNALMNAV
jgi:hypothetical protein